MGNKKHTIKELIELISGNPQLVSYQMTKEEAERLAYAKSAPAWASRYAEMVLREYDKDEE